MELNNTSWKANIICLLFNIYANYLEISVSCYRELWWVRLTDFHSYKCVYCFNTFLRWMWIREYGLKMNHKYSDVVREKKLEAICHDLPDKAVKTDSVVNFKRELDKYSRTNIWWLKKHGSGLNRISKSQMG